ncbi:MULTISPECIES: DUF885 domain-containing protein [unclassified Duganella]|uniref:DUF885 domain-containing protein n=1 Tax=unclassified Duganella TaxID=2636909 RepID=UPI0006FA3AD9|nr:MULTISPECIES: DUF885 domain-containing protein [unclassified Duganella]KQV42989.1 hypothetical protein ASD07_21345 [Duganella sp. Root336D2]KRB97117.1 hypothetical protein ASE26_03530 [Duganella sp. Root198D2]
MMKTRIALAAMMLSLALSPVEAATKSKKSNAPAKTAVSKKSSSKGKTGKSPKSAKGGKSGAKAGKTKADKAKPALAGKPLPAERRQDKAFDSQASQFLGALWRIDPETAISVGKYDTAAQLTVPDQAYRDQQLAFIDEWLDKFGKIDARQLSPKQRSDLGLLQNKLNSDRWYLTTFREWEWNPAVYNIAGPIDFVLNTEYAARPQRLRTLLRRIGSVPAYYEAARNNIKNPTREHVKLAIDQAPGVLAVLSDLDKQVQDSILNANEKNLYSQRIAAAKVAVEAYAAWLGEQDKSLAVSGARSFRIGKELYEAKFGYDIQSGSNAEQTYQKALATREQLLSNMDRISDDLWPKYLADKAKPSDRFAKIGMMIEKLSSNHVPREEFFAEIRRQIPVLQDWVVKNDLLTLDSNKPLVVRETPAYQRGVAGASIEAPGPYRPQDRTYYNVTPLDDASPEAAESTLREYNHWILQILNMHEAIPGHYAQLVYANKSPSIVKSIFGNGAMVEGWAVYSERMMLESGYGNNDPEMWLMYSKWNLRSVTNTILDYSVHVKGMAEQEAIDLLTRQAFQTAAEAKEKWRRAQLTSVQLTSYFSGYSEIMELREQRRAALGSKFSLKEFHEDFLGYGSAPVRVIKELMQ